MSSHAATSHGGPSLSTAPGSNGGYASLGHGFPSAGQAPSQQQPNTDRPIVGLRSVTGDKRKRAQSESRQEQDEADAPVSRLKLERSDSQEGGGTSTGPEDEGDGPEDDDGGANSLDTLTFETGLSDDEGGAGGGSDDDDGGKKPRNTSGAMVMDKNGRKKIQIKYIEDKSRRHITFSKRKAGIMKKAFELSTLTGTQVLLLVVSETGLVYTFTTSKLQPLVTKPEGKNLIQACLNAPTGEAPGGGPSGPGGMTTGNRSRSSTTPGLPIRHKDDTIEYGPDPTAQASGFGGQSAAATTTAAGRKPSMSGGGPARKPRPVNTKSRKGSAIDDDGGASAVASGSSAGGIPPPITGDMLKRREAELAARRDVGSGGGMLESSVHQVPDPQSHPQPMQQHASPLPPQQPFTYSSPSIMHQPPQQQLLPPYSPHGPQHHPQPPPHLSQPYAPLQQHAQYAPHQVQHQQQPGSPHPTSPAHPGNAQHQLWLRSLGQPTYAPPHAPHLQQLQQPNPQQDYVAQQHGYTYTGGSGPGGGYDPGLAVPNGLTGDPLSVGGSSQGTTTWPSSLYNS